MDLRESEGVLAPAVVLTESEPGRTRVEAIDEVLAPSVQMDRIYRYQRHFYDLTRPLFLFGRDRLLRRLRLSEKDRVLEVGCGTARNLLRLKRLRPSAQLYGLDASTQMLETAKTNLRRQKLEHGIELEHGLAEELCHAQSFGLSEPFDSIFFSYALSMIPSSTRAIDAALRSLKPGRSLYILDFWDQAGLPAAVRAALTAWFRLFGVEHRPELYTHLERVAATTGGSFAREVLFGGYTVLAEFRKAPAPSAP
jgi:S-adenosylmethionine-diacylgycerolhomoserine-N-methlytransferase